MNTSFVRHALCGGVAAAALCSVTVAAPLSDAERWMTLRFVQFAYGTEVLTRSEANARLMPAFEHADVDGNGVSASDYALQQRTNQAQQRASSVSMILRDDLDGDGRVTRAEVMQARGHEARRTMTSSGVPIEPTPAQAAEVQKQIVERAMKPDANGDGAITWNEMLAQANEQQRLVAGSYRPHEAVPLTLDGNGDGTVSRGEYKALIDVVFDKMDANRDGKLTPEERAPLVGRAATLQQEEREAQQAEREVQQARELAARCGLPAIPKNARLAVVSAYEGQALSTVALGGDDQEVTVGRLIIERGREPLALALTSYEAHIWLIEGDVSRLARVIVSSQQGDVAKLPRAGVVGVAREKVTVAKASDCLRPVSSASRDVPAVESARFARELGRKPDAVFAVYGLPTMALPSGAVDKAAPFPNTLAVPKTGPSASVWNMAMTSNPKGVVDLDPATVVSAMRATRFGVLPQAAGLAQLVEKGALEITGMAKVISVGNTQVVVSDGNDTIRGPAGADMKVQQIPRQFTIRSQITFPAGLNGGHSVQFILPAGVPEPKGSPGHSAVVRVPNTR